MRRITPPMNFQRSVVLLVALTTLTSFAAPIHEVKRAEHIADTPEGQRAPKVLVALPNYNEETATKLQIFLDNSDFGPGKIDGQMGEFFRKALIHYKKAHGMSASGAIDSWLLDQVPETFTTWTIPPEAMNFIGPGSSKPSEQAKLK